MFASNLIDLGNEDGVCTFNHFNASRKHEAQLEIQTELSSHNSSIRRLAKSFSSAANSSHNLKEALIKYDRLLAGRGLPDEYGQIADRLTAYRT